MADELKDNDSMAFNIVDSKTAEDGLANGTYYMVITIPEDFSANAATVMDDNPKQMELTYQTNPGTNYIASKLSETAMLKLRDNIASQVTETYTETVFDSISEAGDGMQEAADGSGKLEDGLTTAADGNKTITKNLKKLSTSTLTFVSGADSLTEGLKTYTDGVAQVNDGAKSLDDGAKQLDSGVATLTNKVPELTTGVDTLDKGVKQYTAGVDQLNENSDALKSGASSLESGAKALSEGINTLSSGATKYVSGADTLADGTTAYVKGAQELADGAKQLSALESLGDVSDGIAQLNTPVAYCPRIPKENRPKMVNNNWGGTIEDNSFGTHEFLNLCELLGCEPYISGNVGSGTVEEMAKWVEYMTSEGDSPMANLRRKNGRDKAWKVKFFGVGNESWGCGGSMRPEYYSDLYRRYSTYCRNYDSNVLFKIASGASDYDYNWTETLMKQIGGRMDGISLHYYTVGDWNNKGSATDFNTEDYYWTLGKCLEIEDVVKKHIAIMDKYDPKKNIALMVDM